MDRRAIVATAVAGAAMVLLVVAASAGPVRLWTAPVTPEGTPATTAAAALVRVPTPTRVAAPLVRRETHGVTLPPIVGVLLAAVVVVAIVRAARGWRGLRLRPGRPRRATGPIDALPEVPATTADLEVDVDAARAVLAHGTPRNAIVACWMRLEHDAAAAGLVRATAETSAEFVERVVATASVDPAPIGELAALYREARFSRHDLDDGHRARAVAALDRVALALRVVGASA